MPNEAIIAKETEKTSDAPTAVLTLILALAYVALIASYSLLNARLDALLSSVSYRSKVLELLHIDHLGEVKGQVVWAWSI